MSSRAIASTSRAFVSAAAFLILLLAGAARGGEERPLEAALKAAARDGKPVLVLVRRDWDVASLDAGHWLDEPTGFKERLARFHAVKVWSGEKDLAPFAGAPQDGFLFLTPKGETIAVSEVPLLKAKMADLLDGILKWPLPYAALRDAVKADPADAARRAHALAVLEQMGRSDEAAALLAPLAGKEPALAARLEELAAEAPAHQAARAARLVQLLEKLAQAKRADAPPASALEPALREFVSLSGSWPEPARKALAAAHEAAVKYAAAPDTDEAFAAVQQAAAPLPAVLRAAMQALGQEAQKRNAALAQARPADLKVQLAALRSLLRGGERDAKNDAPLKELLDKLIAREMSLEELLRATGLVAYAALLLEQDEACRAWAARLTREAPLGRNVADTFLDLADWAFAAGAEKEADEYYREAEKASSAGESVTLYRAARAMRDAADGRNGPNRSKWAKRTIRDVLVLVPDMDAYANALAAWSDGEFFPVLFQDDEYAPRFAAAFKPRQVLVVPPAEGRGAGDALEPDLLRRTVAAAWERDDGKVPARVGVEDLRERLARVESEPLGLVVSDGVSGETAGGLALAAGRFQGFEIVPVPEIGSGDQKRTAQPNDFLSAAQAWDLAARVLQGLNAIGLPREDRWAAVTLAGAYPYRYSGEVYERWGGTHALEDTLGRDPGDHTRLAVATRLLGDAPRSAYQAMCSLFLQPQDALLFNTYGTNPKTIWGKYRMDFSEAAWKGLLRVDHVNGKDAVIETFRARTGPWNRYGLLTINSSGGSTNWSIGGGGGNSDDFPVGGPVAIHVTHSGSAADVVSPDSLAGRALWGGAYWYFGSTAEPFLTSFQPPSYYGPRIAKGTPFASAFRLRTAQNFWLPWRLMIVGDALCCLRTKEAKRKEYKLEAQPLVRAGERLLTPGGPVTLPPKGDLAAWQAALRLARWCGDRPISSLLSEPPAPALADGPSLGLLLSECVRTYAGTGIVQPGEGGIQLARKHWLAAKPEAQADYAARVYARQALGHLADLALAAKDCAALQERLAELLTAAPSGPLVNRFVEKLEALAKELKKDAEFEAWLAARARDEAAGAFKDVFERQLADRRFAALLAKEQWSGEERAEALKHFVETVKRERRADAVARELRKFHDAVAAKAPAAAGEPLLKELAAVFDPESKEGKRLGEALLAFEKERGYFKHWLFLGPFQDEKAGAWETVAKDGRPDFAATYKDGERDVAWRTLFKPADFGPIDLAKALSPNVNAYVYAAALVKVEKEVAGRLLLGSDDGIVVWIDGQEVHRHEIERGLTPDEDKVQVALKAGEHLVVVRVNQGEGGWGFSARLAGEDDRALPGVVWMCPQPKAEK